VDWEEQKRFRYVDVPALERQAAELMASTDPERKELGRQIAWKAHQAKEAFEQAERARKGRKEIEDRYGKALRQLNDS